MGRWHADAVQRAGGRVVAVVDAEMSRATALAARVGQSARAVADISELLGRGEVDTVHICTPVESHEPLAQLAMEAGAHVLMEKPLTCDAAGTARLYELAARNGALLCPVHQFLFQDGVLAAQRRLPTLGIVRHVELVACSAGAEGRTPEHRESVALDILPHGIALAGRLLHQELAPCTWVVDGVPEGELRALTQVGQTSVMLTVSMASRPTENSLTIRCDAGTIRADLFHGFSVIERGVGSRADKIVRPFETSAELFVGAAVNLAKRAMRREPAYPGLRELVRQFQEAVRHGAESPISEREAIDVARVRDAIMRQRAHRRM